MRIYQAIDLLHDPGNTLGQIDHVWAFLSVDDGGEGICAAAVGDIQLPLITANPQRLDSLRPLAAKIARMSGKPVRLVKFTRAADLEIIRPVAS